MPDSVLEVGECFWGNIQLEVEPPTHGLLESVELLQRGTVGS